MSRGVDARIVDAVGHGIHSFAESICLHRCDAGIDRSIDRGSPASDQNGQINGT
ncbi:hypothetical protein [Agromyces aureus]|uniref:hypothetical protein n=1 Tax=Agromyces aureus TaxID=453304 RepID=UPI0012EDDEE4|nr:hypothetical protein [Agromyces aureus]